MKKKICVEKTLNNADLILICDFLNINYDEGDLMQFIFKNLQCGQLLHAQQEGDTTHNEANDDDDENDEDHYDDVATNLQRSIQATAETSRRINDESATRMTLAERRRKETWKRNADKQRMKKKKKLNEVKIHPEL